MVNICEEESMSQKEATMWARLKSAHRIVANFYMNKYMFYTRVLLVYKGFGSVVPDKHSLEQNKRPGPLFVSRQYLLHSQPCLLLHGLISPHALNCLPHPLQTLCGRRSTLPSCCASTAPVCTAPWARTSPRCALWSWTRAFGPTAWST